MPLQIGYFARLKNSIEAAVKANNNTRAVICGHSLGTLVSTYFLTSATTAAWREEYVAAYFSYSGLYAGASVAFTREHLAFLTPQTLHNASQCLMPKVWQLAL